MSTVEEQVARGLEERLRAHLRHGELFSLSLTCGDSSKAFVAAALKKFCADVKRRDPNIGFFISPDVSPKLRWHRHVIAIIPTYWNPADLINVWCRVSKDRVTKPARKAHQKGKAWHRIRERRELQKLLRHNLEPAGRLLGVPRSVREAIVGPLDKRVTAVGPFEKIWREAAAEVGIPGIEAPARRRRKAKAKPLPSLPVPTPGPGGVCSWCLGEIDANAEKSARWCKCHRITASNALAREVRRVGEKYGMSPTLAKGYVTTLEALGWSRPEALRALPGAAIDRQLLGLAGLIELVDWTRERDHIGRCAGGCGKPLGDRVNAKTCGDGACWQRLARRAASDERLDVNSRAVLELQGAGHRRVALRVADMITNGGPNSPPRLVKLWRPLAAKLTREPRSISDLARHARKRPVTRTDEAEIAAVWIALGVEVEILRKELRFKWSLDMPDLGVPRPSSWRDWLALDQAAIDAAWGVTPTNSPP